MDMKTFITAGIFIFLFWSEPHTAQTFTPFSTKTLEVANENQRHILILFEHSSIGNKTPFYADVFEGFSDDRFVNSSRRLRIPERDSLAKEFNVKNIPSLIILDPAGELRHKVAGAPRSREELESVLTKSLSADESYASLKELVSPHRYDQHDFMSTYFRTILAAGEFIDTVWWERWNMLKFKDKTHPDIWVKTTARLSYKSKNRLCEELAGNMSKYETRLGDSLLKPLFFDVYLKFVSGYIGDEKTFDERIETFRYKGYPYIDDFKLNIKLSNIAAKGSITELSRFLLSDDFTMLTISAKTITQILNRYAMMNTTRDDLEKGLSLLENNTLSEVHEPLKKLATAVLLYRLGEKESAVAKLQNAGLKNEWQKIGAEIAVDMLNTTFKTGLTAGVRHPEIR